MNAIVAGAALVVSLVLAAPGGDGGSAPGFPRELQGVWDAHPWPCSAAGPSDSDMRFTIEGSKRRNYEDDDTLVSVEELAAVPRTWRVRSLSSLDTRQSLVDTRIYILAGDRLTVADDGRTEVYVRCR